VARGGVDQATAAFSALIGERSRTPGFAVVALLLAVALGRRMRWRRGMARR
jgi:hypothetical protein